MQLITVPFETLRRGFDHNSVVLAHKSLCAMHPTDKEKCAQIMKEAMLYEHWNNGYSGKLSVNVLEVTDTEVTFEMYVDHGSWE